jgi:hypothetical protein
MATRTKKGVAVAPHEDWQVWCCLCGWATVRKDTTRDVAWGDSICPACDQAGLIVQLLPECFFPADGRDHGE